MMLKFTTKIPALVWTHAVDYLKKQTTLIYIHGEMTNFLQKIIIIIILEGVWRTISTFKWVVMYIFFSIPSQFESIENTCRIKQEVCKNSSIFWMRGRTNKSEINFLHSKWFWIWKIFLPVLSYVFTISRNVPHKRCCL